MRESQTVLRGERCGQCKCRDEYERDERRTAHRRHDVRELRTKEKCALRLACPKLLENRAELVDLAAVRRPIAGALRGDRAIVMLLCLGDQPRVGCRRGGRITSSRDRRAARRAAAEEQVETLLERLSQCDTVLVRDDYALEFRNRRTREPC